jgi:hypothetical protein
VWVLASALTSHIGLHYNPLASQKTLKWVFLLYSYGTFLDGFFLQKKGFLAHTILAFPIYAFGVCSCSFLVHPL